jgi:hypothetical protein
VSKAAALDPRARELLVKLLWLANSPNPNEREVATTKFFALLQQHDLTPADILVPPPIHTTIVVQPPAPAPAPPAPVPPRQPRTWRDVVADLLHNHSGALFERERELFLPDLLRKGFAPRGGQVAWLEKIIRRTGVRPWDIAP